MTQTTFTIGNALRLTMSLETPCYGLRPESLFSLAARQNPDRAFLFVSKVLGKHIPVRPEVLLAAGKLLALAMLGQPDENDWAGLVNGTERPPFGFVWDRLERTRQHVPLEDRTLFIGFAETATGLARAVADCFTGEIGYIDTTRLEQPGPRVTFQESHSHAKTHCLYLGPDQQPFMAECKRAVLIDDELTTGNTAMQLIETLYMRYGIRRFLVLSILDCSDGKNRRELERRLGIEIQVVSLLKGRINAVEQGTLPAPEWTELCGTEGADGNPLILPSLSSNLPCAARMLLRDNDFERQRAWCSWVVKSLKPPLPNTLYLGMGECIYIPALVAGMHGGTAFQSTTQSPIFPLAGSAVESGAHFDSPEDYSRTGYLYNVPQDAYATAVIFGERERLRQSGTRQLIAYLRQRGIASVQVALL